MNQNRRSLPPPAATNHVVGNVGTSSGDGRSKTLAKSRSARPQSRNTAMLAMATASALLVVHASASKCIDDASYVSPMSLPCSAYAQLDCDGFRHVGWTDSEADELMKKCPSSCRAPHCDNIGTVISQGRSLMHGKVAETEVKWTQGRGEPIQSQVKYRMADGHDKGSLGGTAGGDRTNSHLIPPSNCPSEWGRCRDDPYYHTHVGFHCEAHANLDCTMFEKIGFTEHQVYDLITACPCSCHIECGTWTMSPTSAPSESPTISNSPTSSPTGSPSAKPSSTPTAGPTVSPTSRPSARPSSTPTAGPTDSPTSSPSVRPTVTASATPSARPSSTPSITASSEPSNTPTSLPTASPTENPTGIPSAKPSVTASATPSAQPSSTPSITASSEPSLTASSPPSSSPTAGPTESPTGIPSAKPSVTASKTPSTRPSSTPSITASSEPSNTPSSTPTAGPTDSPTSSPSAMPTVSASATPSARPSSTPSITASSEPSLTASTPPSASSTAGPTPEPSKGPSIRPSSSPSAHPTQTKSSEPSATPSTTPTGAPSEMPSRTHSAEPSALPTSSPSQGPTASPSAVPSSVPSLSPSSIPSETPTFYPSSTPTLSVPPSSLPSYLPTNVPTISPSAGPSSAPSASPSSLPSQEHSTAPTNMPSKSPSSAPSASPTPASVEMATTFTIPLELNNDMTGDDAITVQNIMKTFLRLNQMLGADNVGSNVTIDVFDVLVEDIIPRSSMGDGEGVRERRMKKSSSNESKKSKQGGEEDIGYDDGISGADASVLIRIDDSSPTAALVTSEISAKVRIACNVYPHRPLDVDPEFEFVPRLLGGFASGDYESFLYQLSSSSSTFSSPVEEEQQIIRGNVDAEAVESEVIGNESTDEDASEPEVATRNDSTGTPTTPADEEASQTKGKGKKKIKKSEEEVSAARSGSTVAAATSIEPVSVSTGENSTNWWNFDLNPVDIGAIVGASMLVLLTISAVIIQTRRRRRIRTQEEADEFDDREERPTIFYDEQGQQVIMAPRGSDRHVMSAPTPTNAMWRKQASSNRSKKGYAFSPEGIGSPSRYAFSPEGPPSHMRKQWADLQQEQQKEEQRRMEWDQQRMIAERKEPKETHPDSMPAPGAGVGVNTDRALRELKKFAHDEERRGLSPANGGNLSRMEWEQQKMMAGDFASNETACDSSVVGLVVRDKDTPPKEKSRKNYNSRSLPTLGVGTFGQGKAPPTTPRRSYLHLNGGVRSPSSNAPEPPSHPRNAIALERTVRRKGVRNLSPPPVQRKSVQVQSNKRPNN